MIGQRQHLHHLTAGAAVSLILCGCGFGDQATTPADRAVAEVGQALDVTLKANVPLDVSNLPNLVNTWSGQRADLRVMVVVFDDPDADRQILGRRGSSEVVRDRNVVVTLRGQGATAKARDDTERALRKAATG